MFFVLLNLLVDIMQSSIDPADVTPVTADPAALDAKQQAAVDAAQVAVRSRGYWATVGLRIRDDKVTIACGIVLLAINPLRPCSRTSSPSPTPTRRAC